MSNKVIAKLCAMLVIICIVLTTIVTAFAVEDGTGEVSPTSSISSQGAVSSMQSSESNANSSEDPVASAPVESQGADSVESSVTSVTQSQVVSSTQTNTTSSAAVQSTVSANKPVGSTASVDSFDDSSSKKTSSKQTSSKKTSSKKTSSKKNSSKSSSSKKNDKETVNSSSYVENTVSYQAPTYNEGSLSEDWENNDEVIVSTKEEEKELSDHVFDPKKAVAAWIWLPILIALACIGVLIYVNVYVYNRGAHSGTGVKKAFDDGTGEDDELEEDSEESEYSEDETEEQDEEDPFSAVNFFKFDEDED